MRLGMLGGLGAASETVLHGVADGIKGLVEAPVLGAEEGGVWGGFKGAGKGVVGLFVKPVVGLSDAATDVFEGIKGSASNFASADGERLCQARPQRAFYGHDRLLRNVNPEDSYAVELLRAACTALKISQPSLSTAAAAVGNVDAGEQFVDHVNLGRYVLLLSTNRLCIVDEHGGVQLHERLAQIACCEVRDDGIRLHLFDPVRVSLGAKQSAAGAFSVAHGRGGDVIEETLVRFIKCSTPTLRAAMFDKIQHSLSLSHSEC